jgi:hypothetical protein
MRKARDGAPDFQRKQRPSEPQAVQARAAAQRIRGMRKGRKLGEIKIKELIDEGRR